MKKYLFLLCFLLSTALFAANIIRPYLHPGEQAFIDRAPLLFYADAPLPLQAAVCDVIGIGHVQNITTNAALIKMDSLWYGSLSNVTLTADSCIEVFHYNQIRFPTNNTPILFFFSKYSSLFNLPPLTKSIYSYILNMDSFRNNHTPDGIYLYSSRFSWIPVTQESQHLIQWCSNLVTYAQIQPDRQKFYELLRDGYRLHKRNNRIYIDSLNTLDFFHYFNPSNFIYQLRNDTNLVGYARSAVSDSYYRLTKQRFPKRPHPRPRYIEPESDEHP